MKVDSEKGNITFIERIYPLFPSFLQQISMKFYYRSITIKISGDTAVKT